MRVGLSGQPHRESGGREVVYVGGRSKSMVPGAGVPPADLSSCGPAHRNQRQHGVRI